MDWLPPHTRAGKEYLFPRTMFDQERERERIRYLFHCGATPQSVCVRAIGIDPNPNESLLAKKEIFGSS